MIHDLYEALCTSMPVFLTVSFAVAYVSDQDEPWLTLVVDYITFTFLFRLYSLLWEPCSAFVACTYQWWWRTKQTTRAVVP